MKNISSTRWRKIDRGEALVYTHIILNVKNKLTGLREEITLTPTDIAVGTNSWTQNGGLTFPIGDVISKAAKITINNDKDRFMNYDFNGGFFQLFSDAYENGSMLTPTMSEGYFYIDKVDITTFSITITAYDYIGVLDSDFFIYTTDPLDTLLYPTLWDYFVHLCDDVLPTLLGIELPSGEHLYATHLSYDHFPNYNMSLNKIAYNGSDRNTAREAFGYVAQLACGNIVLSTETAVIDGNRYQRVDILSYNLLDYDYYNGMTFDYDDLPSIEGGEFSEEVTDVLESGLFGSPDAIVLSKYLSPPTFEYTNCQFTGVRINYPLLQTNEKSYNEYYTSKDNILDLYNPLCASATRTDSRVRTVASNIFNRIKMPIRPFSGSFNCLPMAEFMDNVIVLDVDGVAHNSFIGEHTMNYLGTSEISNRTPTQGDNNRKYYS